APTMRKPVMRLPSGITNASKLEPPWANAYLPGARSLQLSVSEMGRKPAAERRRVALATAWNGVGDSPTNASRSARTGSFTPVILVGSRDVGAADSKRFSGYFLFAG